MCLTASYVPEIESSDIPWSVCDSKTGELARTIEDRFSNRKHLRHAFFQAIMRRIAYHFQDIVKLHFAKMCIAILQNKQGLQLTIQLLIPLTIHQKIQN